MQWAQYGALLLIDAKILEKFRQIGCRIYLLTFAQLVRYTAWVAFEKVKGTNESFNNIVIVLILWIIVPNVKRVFSFMWLANSRFYITKHKKLTAKFRQKEGIRWTVS